MMRVLALVVSGVMVLGVSACGGGGALLGQKAAPDETYVVDGPSLTLPPQFSLRPPADGRMVEEALTKQQPANPDDAWLLNQAGAADKNIREKLAEPVPAEAVQVEEAAEDVKDDGKGGWWPF